jgi:hypothetical protein
VQVAFRIDEVGLFDSTGLRVIGLTGGDSTYANQLRRFYQDARFRPAVFEGCAVPFPRWFPLQLVL